MNYLEKEKVNPDSLKEIIKYKKEISKTQQRFKVKSIMFLLKEISKIALSSNGDKRMQSIDLIEPYAHGMSKDVIGKKEKIKHISIKKNYKK